MKIGLLADLHYTSYPANFQNRHTADALDRLGVFINGTAGCDFLLNLGDIINGSPDKNTEMESLLRARDVLNMQPLPVYHTLGNHDVGFLGREDIMTALGMSASDYSFLCDGVRFIVLDTNYTNEQRPICPGYGDWKEAFLTDSRVEWLKRVLAREDYMWAVVVSHQCFDDRPDENGGRDPYAVENAAAVRAVLEKCGKVPLVLNGHCHEGRMRPINGIMYYTQPAMCETDKISYGILTLDPCSGRFGIEPHGVTVEPRLS